MASRIDKFREKLSGDVRKRLYDAQKDQMVANITQPTKDLVAIEIKTKEICQGEPLPLIYYYIIFAKEIYAKLKLYNDWNLINEIEILEEKWRARGLNPVVLNDIKVFFYPPYAAKAHFRVDISLLDGPHILS